MSSSLSTVLLIARREYLERVRTKGFLIATLLIPAVMGALTWGSATLASRAKTTSHVAVVASDTVFAHDLKQQLGSSAQDAMQVDLVEPTTASRARLDEQLQDKHSTLAGYLWVTSPATAGALPHFTYKARSAGDISTKTALEDAISAVLLRERLSERGLSHAEIDQLTEKVTVDTSASGNTKAAFIAAYTMFFLMYMVIMLYAMNTARSIIEEKTSRVFEVMLATIKPEQMLAGKILGVGGVGLTQVGIWMGAAYAYSTFGIMASGGHVLIGLTQVLYFIAYFLFAFFLYSSIAAALGAMTNSEQELQQLNMFLVMPLAFCMVMVFAIIREPNSRLAEIVSLIPFCSPLLMNFRLSLTQVPAWQVGLSFVLMTLTIAVILWISARIYRVGILMYGKKPSLPEILRWLKYS
ncbi:MAG: ABC transporter permease [Acidobacteriaceae bacterium]|nr:ABC transporter permease [Acidobacteriaceae bacterium]